MHLAANIHHATGGSMHASAAHSTLLVEADAGDAAATRAALQACHNCELVGQVTDIAEAVQWLAHAHAQVVLLSVREELPLADIEALCNADPDLAVVVLMVEPHRHPRWTRAILIAGAHECLERERDLQAAVLERVLRYAVLEQGRRQSLARFVSSAAHDLQAPVRQARGFTRILKQRLGPEPPAASLEPLRFIEQAAEQQRLLLDAIVRYARVGQGRVRMQPVALTDLLTRSRDALNGNLGEYALHLTTPGAGTLFGDPELLHLAMVQLLDNAIRYRRSENVEITIALEAGPEDLCLTITDNGIGMNAECLAVVGLPFRRCDPKDPSPGLLAEPSSRLGLGLSLCRRVASAHLGHMEVSSTPQVSTTVRLWLPQPP